MASATAAEVVIKKEPGGTEEQLGPGTVPVVKQEPGTGTDTEGAGGGHEQDPPIDDEDTVRAAEQLAMENERLQQVLLGLQERQSVLEEFIEVEYGERFDKFLNNRNRLVNVMGLGEGENTVLLDGKRTAKSHELVGLLKVVKEQAAASSASSASSNNPNPEPSGSSYYDYNQSNNGAGGGGGVKRPMDQNHHHNRRKKWKGGRGGRH